jgi:hypothetical protein
MEVRTKMSTQAQFSKEVPSMTWVARPVHLEVNHEVGSLEERISSGRALLKVVAYPWGVEFDVVQAEDGQ